MKSKRNFAVVALFVAFLIPSVAMGQIQPSTIRDSSTSVSNQPTSTAAGQLQWFGYAGGGDNAMLDGTASYTNFGEFQTDGNAASTAATDRINAMAQRNVKALVELGKLLWEPGGAGTYAWLYSDYQARWNTWKQANASVLTSSKVLGFIVRDEPFTGMVNIYQVEAAAQMVKQTFPWAKIIMIEAADTVGCADIGCYFNQYASIIKTVDWIGLDKYAFDPTGDVAFHDDVVKMKDTYPGRKFIYVADGFWDASHAEAFGNDINIMRNIMTSWYDVARNDPDAVMLAIFIWDTFGGSTGSRDFPYAVLQEHTRIGREITSRTPSQLYQSIGVFEGIDGNINAQGWACDPDGSWGDRIQVAFYDATTGSPVQSTYADKSSGFYPQCRSSGIGYGFRVSLPSFTQGKKINAYAVDLTSGLVQLQSNCVDAPSCTWYPQSYVPLGRFKISSTGLANGWVCDRDAPSVSIRVNIQDNNGPTGVAVIGVYPANLASEATINSQCGGGTAHRFAVQLPISTKGHAIYIYGVDTMPGRYTFWADISPLLAMLPTEPNAGCIDGWACTW